MVSYSTLTEDASNSVLLQVDALVEEKKSLKLLPVKLEI